MNKKNIKLLKIPVALLILYFAYLKFNEGLKLQFYASLIVAVFMLISIYWDFKGSHIE